MKRLALAAALSIAFIGIVSVLYRVISTLDSPACQNTPIQTVHSPDGELKAVLFSRDCGATTGFSSQVSILRAGDDLPNDGGNVFIADLPQGETATPWGGPQVDLAWRAPKTVELRYDRTARVFKKLETIAGVSVSYPQ